MDAQVHSLDDIPFVRRYRVKRVARHDRCGADHDVELAESAHGLTHDVFGSCSISEIRLHKVNVRALRSKRRGE